MKRKSEGCVMMHTEGLSHKRQPFPLAVLEPKVCG